MRKIIAYFALAAAVLVCGTRPARAQLSGSGKSGFMEYTVIDGDTVYVDAIRAAKIYEKLPRQKGKDWRKYYKLVYNFNKVYPFALEGKRLMAQVDSTLETDNLRRGRKEKYIKAVQQNLFEAYEDVARHMTVSQGALLMRLIDRECGITPYEVVRDYRNGMAAGFWQGIAKLFGTDMKRHYDPEGADAETEDLVKKWEDGDFDNFYYSLFWEYPKRPEIKSGVASVSKSR